MAELSVQQYAAILEFIEEDLEMFHECCQDGSVDFDETLETLNRLAGNE